MVMNTINIPTMRSEIQNAGTTVETTKPEIMVAEKEEVSADEESDDPPPSPRITRARHRYIVMVDSDTDTDTRSLRRRSRQNNIKSQVDIKKGKEEKKKETTRVKTRIKKKKKESSSSSSSEEEDGEYVHVNVGDCVLLDSGDPDNHFIALVSSVQLSANHKDKIGTFTAQWYYKPDDIRDEVRENIPGGVGIKEVFLSPHKDKNSIDAVIGTCDVYSKEEFDEIQMAEQRGFREKSSRLYFMCRYKYYPNRPPKKALEKLSVDFIRGGLGPQKPKIGDIYQAIIPCCLTEDEKQQELIRFRDVDEQIPWKYPLAPYGQAKQVWSCHVVSAHEVLFRQFREMLNLIRFSIGNIIKIYHTESSTCSMMRGMIHQYRPMDSITIGLSSGEIQSVVLSDVYSPLTDDVAFNSFYQSRFNLTRAIYECTQALIGLQQEECVAFLQEIELQKEKERELKRQKQE